jgi:LysR family glycine cleavage system transcriptional activator
MHRNQRNESFRNSVLSLAGGRDDQRVSAPGSRSRLPSLDALRVFEVAARHASFTRAAEELHVTQAAISHRIHALEAELGATLFHRLTRRLELTAEGERLAQGVRAGLERIVRAVSDLDRRSDAGPLTVSMLPSFASRYLIPRLPRFHRAYPEIEVRVLADGDSVDLIADAGTDLAIRFGRGHYPGLAATLLMPDHVVPVCSPRLLEQYGPVDTVDELLDMPLLLDSAAERDDSGTGWKSWLAHIGAAVDDRRIEIGTRFSQAHLAIEAAVLGQGVALARTSLAGDDIASGRLVRPLRQSAPTAFKYFLVCRPEAAQWRKVACFSAWLIDEVKIAASQQAGVAA